MNLNQAKAVAGIAAHEPIAGREALERAVKYCTKRAAQYHPDRNPNDKAAEKKFLHFIEARDFFKKRIPRGCAVCGVTIGKGATHCQIHQAGRKVKVLPAAGLQVQKRNGNSRTRLAVGSDPLAVLGYHTAPVQKAVSKWRTLVGEPMLKRYFEPVAQAVISRQTELNLPFVAPQHWPAVFDLGNAIAAVLGDVRRPHGWLLRLPGIHVAEDGAFPSCIEIVKRIKKESLRETKKEITFTLSNIAQALTTMKLATPDAIRKDYRESVMKRAG